MRHHGWQLPLHPLQIVAMGVFSFLVVAFYVFIGPFLGSRIAVNTVVTLFSFTVISVAILFARCTAIDPSDRTGMKKKKKKRNPETGVSTQLMVRFLKRMEAKIMKNCIRRKYLNPSITSNIQFEPLVPFHLVENGHAISPHLNEKEDVSFCSLCDLEVKLHSKHCKSCNRCVEGFDHHCKWLNNCIGRKNYTSFILLLVFVLLMMFVQAGACIAILVRCFASRRPLLYELDHKLHTRFPIGVIVTISTGLGVLALYCSVALGQLFFFHILLIKKGIRTYDYILAMREQREREVELFEDSSDSEPEELSGLSSISVQAQPIVQPEAAKSMAGRSIGINPWRLLDIMSKEKALPEAQNAELKPQHTLVAQPNWQISSPRRRFSGSLSTNFDLNKQLSELSKEFDTHNSGRQLLCSVFRNEEKTFDNNNNNNN